ncbi:hypothetical protein F511_14153 [Dorcoceras hygrometricum]|uniref:Uncharacterized protein n=1 Tax=Dorcoceras hygrometricum TaxID=472368 RepID=A0A2Z7D0S1_9LAMI|nr:hypothetical protein F511_14153 [Dorcoceras hygrometricum]
MNPPTFIDDEGGLAAEGWFVLMVGLFDSVQLEDETRQSLATLQSRELAQCWWCGASLETSLGCSAAPRSMTSTHGRSSLAFSSLIDVVDRRIDIKDSACDQSAAVGFFWRFFAGAISSLISSNDRIISHRICLESDSLLNLSTRDSSARVIALLFSYVSCVDTWTSHACVSALYVERGLIRSPPSLCDVVSVSAPAGVLGRLSAKPCMRDRVKAVLFFCMRKFRAACICCIV